jgi:GNAT superfamily N-acetyltransferase
VSDSFRVQSAAPSDVPALTTLRIALFRELGQGPSDGDESAFRTACEHALTGILGEARGLAWLARSEAGEAIGSNVLLLYPRIPSPRSPIAAEGYVLSVYTHPEWRGQGVGTALLRAAIAEARRRGLARIRLHATAAGHPIYAAAGFAGRTDEMELWL